MPGFVSSNAALEHVAPKQLGVDITVHPGTGLIKELAGYQEMLLGLTAALAAVAIAVYLLKALVLPGMASERLETAVGGIARVCVIAAVLAAVGTIASWVAGIGDPTPYINAATR